MARIRYAHPGYIYEVSTRTLDGMCLLRPSKEVNKQILGVIGRAQAKTDVRIHGMAFASTHYHMLIAVDSTEQMSSFMRIVNADITKKLNKLTKRHGTSWAGRFHSILVDNDEETQVSRLRYLMAHGVKERLVSKLDDWPAVSSNPWLLRGEKLVGIWTDHTAQYYARRRKSYVEKPGDFDTKYEVKMSVLPCWQHLPEEEWRARAKKLAEEIDADAAAFFGKNVSRRRRAKQVRAILDKDPRDRIVQQTTTEVPLVLAANKKARKALEGELFEVFAAYREASKRFRAGEFGVAFPVGTFRPGGGFVAVV